VYWAQGERRLPAAWQHCFDCRAAGAGWAILYSRLTVWWLVNRVRDWRQSVGHIRVLCLVPRAVAAEALGEGY